jgi:hypothetical protein
MSDLDPALPFYLIIADHDARLFTVEGPMTNDAPWNLAAGRARERDRLVHCGPNGVDRDTLAVEYQKESKLGVAPPGSIIRPRG